MGKIGKISVIPKDFSNAFATMEKSLRDRSMSRVPGTIRMLYPYKELNGKYRTGLDENSTYLLKLEKVNPEAAKTERKRIKEERKRLEELTGMDLSPSSRYYNYTSTPKETSHKVDGAKLIDGDNIFNLDDPWQAITFYWVKSHPAIASSLKDYKDGKFPSDTQYYVNDEDVENELEYRKRKTANDAIIKFSSWSLEKRRKVARLLDLPISEDTKEEFVYTAVDNFLKNQQVATGVHKGKDPIRVFASYADLKDDVLYTKDLIEMAFKNQIYQEKRGGKVYEGELEVFKSKDELLEHLLDEKNQEDVLAIEKKLKLKSLAHA